MFSAKTKCLGSDGKCITFNKMRICKGYVEGQLKCAACEKGRAINVVCVQMLSLFDSNILRKANLDTTFLKLLIKTFFCDWPFLLFSNFMNQLLECHVNHIKKKKKYLH